MCLYEFKTLVLEVSRHYTSNNGNTVGAVIVMVLKSKLHILTVFQCRTLKLKALLSTIWKGK